MPIKDLAPQIVRQRLLLEATYERPKVTAETVSQFLLELAAHLQLRTYGEPIIHSPGGEGKEENQGFDAFVPLIDSGIALYIWSNEQFLSCVLYTCKEFDVAAAEKFTADFWQVSAIETAAF